MRHVPDICECLGREQEARREEAGGGYLCGGPNGGGGALCSPCASEWPTDCKHEHK